MSWTAPIRVVAIGSPLGDDRVAWEVLRRMRQRIWRERIDFHELEGGQRLLDVLDGKGSLLLIDALAPSGNPGSIHRFAWSDDRLEVLRPGSTHHLRPAEVMQLASTLHLLPEQVVVMGIEGERFDPSDILSPSVAAAVPEAVQRVIGELEEIGHHA
jgi:hydrogenase maturation protease